MDTHRVHWEHSHFHSMAEVKPLAIVVRLKTIDILNEIIESLTS